MSTAGTAKVKFVGDFSGMNAGLASALAPARLKKVGLKAGLAIGGGLALAGAAKGLMSAINVTKEFEQQLSSLGAVAEASDKQMGRLRKQAIKLGADTVFSASEAAQAQIELAKGGLSASQILSGALKSSLDLAAAGELDLAQAAETTVNAMQLFEMQGKSTGAIADMLATAANRTTADVEDFAMSLKMGGSVAKQAGFDLNDTVVILEALAEAGIKNSDAGTSMKTTMIQLLNPTVKQRNLAKELGINWLTANGELKNGVQISKELRVATEDMTKAERTKTFAVLAGSDGFRTLSALYDAGAKKLQAYSRANQKQGTAAEVAARKTDNLAGDMEELSGAWETLQITVGSKLTPALRDLTQSAAGAVREVTKIFTNKNLTGAEKFGKILDLAIEGAMKSLEKLVGAAFDVGPKIAQSLARGFANAPIWAQLATTGILLKMLGGPAGIAKAGSKAGLTFGSTFAAAFQTAQALGATRNDSLLAGFGAMKNQMPRRAADIAKTLAGSLARVLPAAVALFGLGDVLSSAIAGDTTKALQKAGAGLAGAGLGFAIGGPLGAAIGGGIGLGISRLFDSDKSPTKTLRERIQADMKRIAEMVRSRSSVFGNLSVASKNLVESRKREKAAADMAARAEKNATAVRKRYGRNSIEAARANARLAESIDKARIASRKAKEAERLHGVERKATKVVLRGQVREYRDVIERQRQNLKATREQLRTQTRAGASAKVLERLLQQENNQSKRLNNTKVELNKTIAKSSQQIGPRFAKALRNVTSTSEAAAKSIRKQERFTKNLDRSWLDLTPTWGKVGRTSKTELGKAERATKNLGDESRTTRKKVVGNFKGMASEGSKGIGILMQNTQNAQGALGVKTIQFKAIQVDGKQRGGPIDLGKPSGDSVPALLERGEYVLNRNAVRAVGKDKLDDLNFRQAKRFQKGGGIGGNFNVDGAKPGFVPFMNYLNSMFGPIYVMSGLRPGSITTSGNISNHASGNAVDISTHENGLNMVASEAALNATGRAAKRMDALHSFMARYIKLPGDFLWRTFTGGNHYNHIHRGITSAHADNPDLMAQYLSGLPEGAGFAPVPKVLLKGEGPLRRLGQAAIDKVRKAITSRRRNQWATPNFDNGKRPRRAHEPLKRQTGGPVLMRMAKGGWVRVGYTTYSGSGPGAFGSLPEGDAFAELGTATSGGAGTGTGYLAKAFGMSGELGKDFPIDIKIGSIGKVGRLYNRDRGYGQGDPFYAIDIHDSGFDQVGLSGHNKGVAYARPAEGSAKGGKKGPTKAEIAARERKRRKENRTSMLERLWGRIGSAKTLLGEKGALANYIKQYALYGSYDKGEKQHIAGAFRKAFESPSTVGGIGTLRRLGKWMQNKVDISGEEDGDERFLKNLKKIQEAARERRKKKIQRFAKNRKAPIMDFPGKQGLVRTSRYLAEIAETIGLTETRFSSEASELGGDFSDSEVGRMWQLYMDQLFVQKNRRDLLKHGIGYVTRVKENNQRWVNMLEGRDDDGIRKMLLERMGAGSAGLNGRPVKAVMSKKQIRAWIAKNKWKLKGYKAAVRAANETLGDKYESSGLRGDLAEMIGLTGDGGAINDTRQAIVDLGFRAPAAGSSDQDSATNSLLMQMLTEAQRNNALLAAHMPIYEQFNPKNLPAFHGGGVYNAPAGRVEGPALLRDGEGVFTPEQMAALNGGADRPIYLLVEDGAVDDSKIRAITADEFNRRASKVRRSTRTLA